MSAAFTDMFIADGSESAGYRPATPEEVLACAREGIERRYRRGRKMDSPACSAQFLTHRLAEREHEVFVLLMLDNRHRLIECVEMFRGTIDGASVYPREVVKESLRLNAAAVIAAHNHPSGVCEPSQADQILTRRIREALALVDIRLLDHIIVAGSDTVSLAQRGLL
jgi:DNA repair protein RadC